MVVQLSPQLQALISQLVNSGHYSDASDVVNKAVHLLNAYEHRSNGLRATLQAGLDDVERGAVAPFTPQTMRHLLKESEEAFLKGDTPDPDVCP